MSSSICNAFRSFNSTLVQLKGLTFYLQKGGNFSFNSTLVQLKAYRMKYNKEQEKSFNSTLVQLKVLSVLGQK